MAGSLVALRVDGGGVSLTRRTGPLRLFSERPDHPAVSVLVRDTPPPSRRASIAFVRDAPAVSALRIATLSTNSLRSIRARVDDRADDDHGEDAHRAVEHGDGHGVRLR